MTISDVVKSAIRNNKTAIRIAAATGIALGTLSGCSHKPADSSADYSATKAMEYELINLIQQKPQIPGLNVDYRTNGTKIAEAEYTEDGIRHILSLHFDFESGNPDAFLVSSDDGKKLISVVDSGSGSQRNSEPLDAEIDTGRIREQGRDVSYNRYPEPNQNTDAKLRKELQTGFNYLVREMHSSLKR
ncbi:MAG: hypothetical protein V1702_05835 [Candidatus Woesearchaeota archaeon]